MRGLIDIMEKMAIVRRSKEAYVWNGNSPRSDGFGEKRDFPSDLNTYIYILNELISNIGHFTNYSQNIQSD